MKYSVLSFFLVVFSSVFAQNTSSISGKIVDKATQKPLEFASVILKNIENETLNGVVTDKQGSYVFEKLNEGDYVIHMEYVGYTSVEVNQSVKTNENAIVETVYLSENAEQLDAVLITGEKSTIEQSIDKKTVNVGKDLVAQGPLAIDLMNNLPAVNVNSDGNITYRGSENVRVMIDGKLSNLENPSDVLEQIPSDAIQKIELISNPSAKYNPDGLNGIINIVLKKSSFEGWNLGVNSGVTFAQRTRFNNSVSLNYKPGKANFFLQYANRFGDQITDGELNRFDLNSSQKTFNINNRKINNLKLGVDFPLDDKNLVSVFTNQNFFKAAFDGEKSVFFYDDESMNFIQDDFADINNHNQVYNLDYKHLFDGNDHFLEFEVNYNSVNQEIDNDFRYVNLASLPDYTEAIENKSKVTTFNLDYAKAFSAKSKIELGLETRINAIDYSYNTSSEGLYNSNLTYDRDILSSYVTWSSSLGKVDVKLGSRFEYYNVAALFEQETLENQTFGQELFNVFPSAFFSYKTTDESPHTYQLSYGRRIERPSFKQINPIRQFTSPQVVSTGNLLLTPQFSNSLEFNYLYNFSKGSLSFGTFYRHLKDEIARNGIFDQDDPNLLRISYDNFDSNNAYGGEIGANFKVFHWWRVNSNLEVYSRTQKGIIETEQVEVQNVVTNVKWTNNFTLSKKWKATLFALYSGKQKVLQYELKPNYYLNTGVRYSFAKGKGSASLNFNDVFGTRRFAFETYRTVFQEGEFFRDTQQVFLGLSYRFGGKLKTTQRKKRDNNIKADKFL